MIQSNTPYAVVIDDAEDIRMVVRMALEFSGWEVGEARDGREGLERVRERRPTVILLDLMMSGMSGLEFAHHLIDRLKMSDVPVVMISAVNEQSQAVRSFWELPFKRRAFLHKPFSNEEMRATIQSVLTNSSAPPSTPPTPEKPVTAASSPQPTRVDIETHKTGYRILVVDDDPDIRMVLKSALGMYHHVECANNGMEGIHATEVFEPDMIIADINMPVMDGLAMVKAIRSQPATARIPVFFLTAETRTALPREAFEVGGNLFLRKPIDPMRVVKCLDHFIGEMGLLPGRHGLEPKPEKTKPPAAPTPPAASGAEPLRILAVTAHPVCREWLDRVLGEKEGRAARVEGGPFDLMYEPDINRALGGLPRWEPDLILFRPHRAASMDAVAFGQMMSLREKGEQHPVAFIGEEFTEAERAYSERHYGYEPVNMSADEAIALERLSAAIAAARRRWHAKKRSLEDIRNDERSQESSQENTRRQREREMLKNRYDGIQAFIDREFIG